MHINPNTAPQIEFHGTGIRVNGAEVSGEVIVAWIEYAADRGYVLKCDGAFPPAFDRTQPGQEQGNLYGVFDATTALLRIASGAGL
jgi:hypothetical protein